MCRAVAVACVAPPCVPTPPRLFRVLLVQFTKGSLYMQTIDDKPEKDLRQFCKNTCGEAEVDTHILAVDEMLQRIDRKSEALYLSSIMAELRHFLIQYQSVLEQAGPILNEESSIKGEERDSLVQEWHSITDCFSGLTGALQSVHTETLKAYNLLWHQFWLARMNEIVMVFQGKVCVGQAAAEWLCGMGGGGGLSWDHSCWAGPLNACALAYALNDIALRTLESQTLCQCVVSLIFTSTSWR